MSFSYKLRSHPDRLLIDHLENVGKLSESIVGSKHIKNKDVISKLAYLIGVSHDFAKATTFFQKWLDDREERTERARHGFLSSILGYYLVKRYLVTTNRLAEFRNFPTLAWIAVKRHHGNVQNVRWDAFSAEIAALDESSRELVQEQTGDIVQNNLDEVMKIYEKLLEGFKIQEFIETVENWGEVAKEIKMDVVNVCRQKEISSFFYFLFFYSVLLDADKLDASETEIPARIEDVPRSMVDNYMKSKFSVSGSPINTLRDKAYKEVANFIEKLDLRNERILAINLPTGMGKTLTGLSFSLGLRERIEKELGFAPRIIYCLPFLSIIDQNSVVLEEVFKVGGNYNQIPSNLFLKHHHLADIMYSEGRDGELDLIKDLNKSLLLVEGWNSEIVITTFVQFFHSLITNRNRPARKFHNILNSIVILDEVQSIPHKYWLLINESLKHLAKEFDCWIVLMTATQPLIFEAKNEVKHLVMDRESYFQAFDRVEFGFDLDERRKFKETEFDDFKRRILDEITINRYTDLMVVLNTISSCKELYEFLKERLSERDKIDAKESLDKDGICSLADADLINLSTNILPSFRLRRISRIKDEKRRKIVITTQLIEAGVDISVDVVYRDMAPLDCIIQSAGRCNRNNEKQKGKVYVILLKDGRGRKLYSYVYDQLLIDATYESIKGFGGTISEKEFVAEASKRYYDLIQAWTSRDISRDLLDNMKKLNFGDTCEFRLIEETLPSTSIFVEVDEEAGKIGEEAAEIFSLHKRFERKEKLLAMRREINENTITVRYSRKTEKIESLPSLDGELFRYVPREELDSWYRLDSGFYVSKEDVAII